MSEELTPFEGLMKYTKNLAEGEVSGYPEGLKVHPDSYSDPYREAREAGVEFKSIQQVAEELSGPTGTHEPILVEEEEEP